MFDSYLPRAQPKSALLESRSFAEFRRMDKSPRASRLRLQHLQLVAVANTSHGPSSSRSDRFSLRSIESHLHRISMDPLKSLFHHNSTRTKPALLNELRLAIIDLDQDRALDCVHALPASTFHALKTHHLRRCMLYAMAHQLEAVVIEILRRGFPADVTSPVLDTWSFPIDSSASTSSKKLVFPSWFHLACAFNLYHAVHYMLTVLSPFFFARCLMSFL